MKGGSVDTHYQLSLFPIPITEQPQLSYDKCAGETLINFSPEVQVFIYTPALKFLVLWTPQKHLVLRHVSKSI